MRRGLRWDSPWPLLIALFVAITDVAEGVRCFCDRLSCEDSQTCNAEYCIAGERINDGDDPTVPKFRQLCGEGDPRMEVMGSCVERFDGWQKACFCNEEFCNTLTFYFAQSKAQGEEGRLLSPHSQLYPPSDSSAPFFSPNNDDNRWNNPQENHRRNQTSSLVVLLVIIPLSVGGLAVCLIFLNYHCKMC